MSGELALVAALVLLNAALAGTEMALVSLRESQVERLSRESVAGARLAAIAENPSRFLATIQVGITLAGFGASASAAVSLAGPVEPLVEPLVGASAARGVAVAAVTVVLAFLTLVLGELVPKRIGIQTAERWSLLAARPLGWLQVGTAPAVWLLERTSNGVVRLFGFDPDAEPEELPEEELREIVTSRDDLTEFQRSVMEGAFEVAARRVGQVLTARRFVFHLDMDLPAIDGRVALAGSGYSRAPVCGPAGLDDVRGVVHLRDLLDVAGGEDDTVLDRSSPPVVLPESVPVLDALRNLQGQRAQLAVVLDEHGGGEGIVTVEDLVEELVGEIFDEADPDHRTVQYLLDGTLVLPGSFPAHDLADFELHVPDGPYTTVAGFMLDRLGRLPDGPGDVVEHEAWLLRVDEVTGRAISRVALTPPPEPADEPVEDD